MYSSLTRTSAVDIAGVISAESCHIVLDTNPPDYVEKISRYLESSVGYNNVTDDPESDSGDSLFITQKPVPEAARSGRRRHYSLRSAPTSPRELEESGEDSGSSSSHGDSVPKRRKKKYTLPKYRFPFLTEQNVKLGGALLPVHNKSLHNYVMGGFFKCVRELQQDCQKQDLESSLPTVDMDGECISPLSEDDYDDDDDRPADEDIKVVERARFLALPKAKGQQTSCNRLKQKRRLKVRNAGQETSKGLKMNTIPVSADSKSSDEGGSSCRVLVQRNFLAETEAAKTRGNEKFLSQLGSEVELCNDNHATVCEPRTIHRKQSTQMVREGSTTVTQPRMDVFHTEAPFPTGQAGDGSESQNLLHSLSDSISDTNNDSVCSETKVKQKKDNGNSVEEGKGQSRDEPEGLHASTSLNVEVEEAPSLSRDNMAEAPATRSSDELELNEKNAMENSTLGDNELGHKDRDNPDSKQRKKRRKKDKSAAENAAQEAQGDLESDARVEASAFSVSCNEEDGGKKKKKKKRTSEDGEQLQSSTVAEPLQEDKEIQRKKKKKKKKEGVVITQECEEEEVSNRTLDVPPVKVLSQMGTEVELCNYNHATVCEQRMIQRKQSTQTGREASTTVMEPRMDVFHTEAPFLTGQAGDGSESQNFLHSLSDPIRDTNNDSICSDTKVKQKKDNGNSVEEGKGQSRDEAEGLHASTSVNVEVEEAPSLSRDTMAEAPATRSSDELELNETNAMENSTLGDNELGHEDRDNPDSKQKKKRRKKDKSAAENAAQEAQGDLESDARVEASAFSVSCNEEDGGNEKKKKKRKKKRTSEDGEQLQSSTVAEPLHEDEEIQRKKKKKKKKKEGVVITQECEEEEVSNRTLDVPPVSTKQFEESGSSLENAAAPHETLESSYSKRKKSKKQRQSSSNDATQDVDEGVGLSFCLDNSVTLAEGSGMSIKKKKTLVEGGVIAYTGEENETVENVDKTQKTNEGLKDPNAEPVTKKKKKKKMSELFSQNISDGTEANSSDSGSLWGKEKKRTSSFLVADAEENGAQTNGEHKSPSQSVCGAEKPSVSTGDFSELNDGVTKKKKKRKMSVMQDSVEKDREQAFEEPHKTCGSALSESTDTGVKRKKKRTGSESESVVRMERLESAADAGLSPSEEAVASKKKKKKCRKEPIHVVQEGPPAASEDVESVKSPPNTCRSVSHRKKRKQGHSHDGSTISDQTYRETQSTVEHASASSEAPGELRLNDMRDVKKKKKMKYTTPGRISDISETSLGKIYHITENKHKNVKRRLHNPNEEFLADCS